jgi:hypothetical protein
VKTDESREHITLTTWGKGKPFLAELLNESKLHWEDACPANVLIFLPAPPPDDWMLRSKKIGR